MLNLYQSNRLDALFPLYMAVRQPPNDPLTSEALLVPSLGMQRWIQIEMAKQQGIAANLDFKLPAAFMWQLILQVFPDTPKLSAFDREVMAWRILHIIPSIQAIEGSALAANWEKADEAGRYELAWRVADVFDQYLIYRPEWLASWEAGKTLNLGEDEAWQKAIWLALAQKDEPHRAKLFQALLDALKSGKIKKIPEKISVFGISTLPPSMWHLLVALGEKTEIDLFLLNPSQEYWGQLRKGDSGESDHQLLASLGQQGRDFISTVASSGVSEPVGSQAFVDFHEKGSVLSALQSDFLHQRVRSAEDKITTNAKDDSLQVHICHSN